MDELLVVSGREGRGRATHAPHVRPGIPGRIRDVSSRDLVGPDLNLPSVAEQV